MKDLQAQRIRLGAFEVDLRAGEVRDGERAIVLPEQPFQILRMLIERAGEIVTREEIQKKLWPNDTVVEFDHSINAAINKLRQVSGRFGGRSQVHRNDCPAGISPADGAGAGCWKRPP